MFIDKLGKPHVFQTFDDRPKKDPALIKQVYGTLTDNDDTLHDLNKKGAGVFFTVNETKGLSRKAANITRVRALFLDLDTVDNARSFSGYPIPPSAIIESSPGKHHLYWFVKGALPLDEFKRCQATIARAYGGDPKVNDLPRVMRVPGFLNNKNVPFLVREIGGSGAFHPVDHLLNWVNSLPGEPEDTYQPVSIVDAPQAGGAETDMLLWQLSQAGEGERNDTLNRVSYQLLGMVKAGRLERTDTYHKLQEVAISIGLSRAEAVATIQSAWRGAKPIHDDVALLPDYPPPAEDDGVQLVAASSFKARNPDWLWPGWLCRGKLHILAGSPSTGKTTLFLKLAAIISSGGRWPDGTYARPQNVIMWSGEDDPEDVLLPRLERAGANTDKVFFPPKIKIDGDSRFFDPSRDIPALHLTMLKKGNIGLLGIDPIMSVIQGDGHKNTEVRRSLQPLVTLGAHVRCPVVGIAHFTKGTKGQDIVERVSGSGAIGQLTRIVLATSHDPETDTRTVVRAKSNLGENGGGYTYTLEYGPLKSDPTVMNTAVVFGDEVTGTAAEIIHKAESTAEEKSAIEEATEFLTEYLEDGARTVKAVNGEAKRLGITAITLRRAKRALGIRSQRDDFGGWEWALPKDKETNIK